MAGAGCLGAVDHYLGLLATLRGDAAAARPLLLRGRKIHIGLQAPLLIARSDKALADADARS